MKKIRFFLIRIQSMFAMATISKTDIVSTKLIYDWESKTRRRIHNILTLEVQWLLQRHPGYKLRGFKKPIHLNNGALLYKIVLKKK